MKIFLLICFLLISVNAYAQLSIDDESYLKETYVLEKLIAERAELISQRDADILVETEKYNSLKTTIEGNYEIQIDAIEQDIADKRADISVLIGK